jgi:hypothetical protein
MLAASRMARRWESVYHTGQLRTTSATGSFSSTEAVAFIRVRYIAVICVAVNCSFLPRYVTSAPTWPFRSMRGAETKSCSTWTSGSLSERPARRTNDETVFLRLEISWFLAASPMYLLLGPKPTSDLLCVSFAGEQRRGLLTVSRGSRPHLQSGEGEERGQ